MRFVREDAVICMVEPRDTDPNHKVLKEIRERLDDVKAPDGGKLEIIEIEMPQAIEMKDWRLSRLPASYANFLICNTIILVPTYRSPKQDGEAIEILQSLFPTRRVAGLDCTALVWGLGSIHCVTQQQPKVGRVG